MFLLTMLMKVTMTSDNMACGMDGLDQLRIAVGDIAQDIEETFDLVAFKATQHVLCRFQETTFLLPPLCSRKDCMVVGFQITREQDAGTVSRQDAATSLASAC